MTIQWQVIGIFGYQHVGNEGFGRQPARDQPVWRGRLYDAIGASAAGAWAVIRDWHGGF